MVSRRACRRAHAPDVLGKRKVDAEPESGEHTAGIWAIFASKCAGFLVCFMREINEHLTLKVIEFGALLPVRIC